MQIQNNMNKIRYILAFMLVGVSVAGPVQATQKFVFKLANVLQSNMVVQQDKPFKLWGTAQPGETLVITTGWGATARAKVNGYGNWTAAVDVPKARPGNFTPYTISIQHLEGTAQLSNILIGDVWFCVGQSNMDMPVTEAMFLTYPGVLNYKEEIAAAKFPAIRFYKANAEFKVSPQDDTKGKWQVCSPETIGGFSGVAYFFGRELFLKLNIPIGLVVSAAPGASTQAFTSREVLEGDASLKETYLDPQLKNIEFQHKVDSAGFFTNVTKPTLLYNGIIYPFLNLSIKGITYYQGESNSRSDSREKYISLFKQMVANWRRDFKQGELPFYYTQIAPFREAGEDSLSYKAAIFRETQQQLLQINNTGMAVTLDAGSAKTVHPPDKRSVGERLAKNALNKTYGLSSVQYLGPRFSAYKVQGNTIVISFDKNSLDGGLVTKNGQAPAGFMVAGDDKQFHEAQARIAGNQIILSGYGVAKPVAIRYAFTNWVGTNLQNKAGLPAMQFRTDNWE